MHGILPSTIGAGVNFSACAWRAQFSGADWALTLLLRGPAVIDLTANRDGARHVWDIAGGLTKDWTPGEYAYAIRATNGEDIVEVESGRVRIVPDLAAMPAGDDGRSPNRIALDAIEAVIAKRATQGQERYRINNRELYRTPIVDLLKLRAHYLERVAREQAQAQGRALFGQQVKVVMRPMGG